MRNQLFKILLSFSLLVSIGSFVATKSSQAEALQKSPRVAELEDKLTRDASAYLKGRFPDQPFTVLVNIDPLRRNEGQAPSSNAQKDDLPYLDVQNDDVQDEWDNPQVSLSELMVRIKRASVAVSVPSAVTDDETTEIKTALFSLLHLTPARDEVLLERKKWNSNSFPWLYVEIVSTMLFVLLIGLLFVHRNSAHRLAHALSQLKGNGGQSQNEQSSQSVSAAPVSRSSDSPKRGGGGDVKFSDPIRLKELATRLIDSLVAQKSFPNLRQMIALDQLGRRNAPALGSLLTEFPLEARKRVFSLSSDPSWLEALYSPGTMTMEALDALQTVHQQTKDVKSPAWEQLLILVWRLGDKTDGFFRGINQPKAFAILNELPKSVSIHAGRRSFPGNWGSLLDPTFKTVSLDEADIKELTATALNLQPLSDIESLNRYREQIELLEYIKLADPREEREIYGACPPDSMIHKIRKPFYPVFEQSEDQIRLLIKSVPFDQWAVAFFNISRSERKIIEAQFSEKQRYLLSQRLKQLDSQPPDRDGIESARTQIAELCAALKNQPQEEEALSLKSEFDDASKIAA
jgi:hypothetical protein